MYTYFIVSVSLFWTSIFHSFSFQCSGPHKTSINYSIFPITPAPNLPTLFIILIFIESLSQHWLTFLWDSYSLGFHLKKSERNVLYYCQLLHEKWQLANKTLWFNDVLMFQEYLYIHQLYLTLGILYFLYLRGFKWLAWLRGGYIPKQEL